MTHSSHQQLVEEWKEKLRQEWNARFAFSSNWEDDIKGFLEAAMLAAAKGAAEAGKVHNDKEPPENDTELHQYFRGRNGAISQSERQLEDYFKEI